MKKVILGQSEMLKGTGSIAITLTLFAGCLFCNVFGGIMHNYELLSTGMSFGTIDLTIAYLIGNRLSKKL